MSKPDTERVYAVNRAKLTVGIDIGRDMDQKTFDRLVAAGDLTPVKPGKKASNAGGNPN